MSLLNVYLAINWLPTSLNASGFTRDASRRHDVDVSRRRRARHLCDRLADGSPRRAPHGDRRASCSPWSASTRSRLSTGHAAMAARRRCSCSPAFGVIGAQVGITTLASMIYPVAMRSTGLGLGARRRPRRLDRRPHDRRPHARDGRRRALVYLGCIVPRRRSAWSAVRAAASASGRSRCGRLRRAAARASTRTEQHPCEPISASNASRPKKRSSRRTSSRLSRPARAQRLERHRLQQPDGLLPREPERAHARGQRAARKTWASAASTTWTRPASHMQILSLTSPGVQIFDAATAVGARARRERRARGGDRGAPDALRGPCRDRTAESRRPPRRSSSAACGSSASKARSSTRTRTASISTTRSSGTSSPPPKRSTCRSTSTRTRRRTT